MVAPKTIYYVDHTLKKMTTEEEVKNCQFWDNSLWTAPKETDTEIERSIYHDFLRFGDSNTVCNLNLQ